MNFSAPHPDRQFWKQSLRRPVWDNPESLTYRVARFLDADEQGNVLEDPVAGAPTAREQIGTSPHIRAQNDRVQNTSSAYPANIFGGVVRDLGRSINAGSSYLLPSPLKTGIRANDRIRDFGYVRIRRR
jgi:hypothetical protein